VRIERIDVFARDLPFLGGTYRLSGGRSYTSFDATFVRLTADTGHQGWGESTPFGSTYIASHPAGVRAGIEQLAEAVLGRDPRHVDRINETMDAALVGHLDAKTPIDVACWDLFGQSVGMPVCDLLGGRTEAIMPVVSSIHSGTPDDMRARVAEYRSRGFRAHSVKIGAAEADGGPALDAARIRACLADREMGEYFVVDANGGLTVEHALRMVQGADFALEAPCATWRECISLRRRSNIPIIMDELAGDDETIARIVADDAADGISLKVSKCGGLTRGRRQRDICIASGLSMSVQDTVGSEVAYAAILHLGQTVPARHLRCVLDCRYVDTGGLAEFDIPIADGGVRAPDRPGLGVRPKPDVLGDPIATYGS
jgi:L-alanine-DL-glutamate epimerase-like enolase superfamily enzyme